MGSNRTLVFGDDLSSGSDLAWLFINRQTWPAWKLQVVTAVMPPIGPPRPANETTLHAWTPPRPRVDYAEANFERVEHLTAKGDPRVVLRSADADLMVIGPRGPGLLKAIHLGSTAEWLLTNSRAPVLIARHGQPVRRALVCTDGSPHSVRATDVLAEMPWIGGVNVTVLAIADGRVDVVASTKHARKRLEAAGADVHTASGPEGTDGVLAVTGVASPTSLISHYVEESAPDLVVLGTRGLTGWKRLRLGSTAGAIARTTNASVLLAHVDEDN
jgi:nucleotide-binding universal stress UspA family protein